MAAEREANGALAVADLARNGDERRPAAERDVGNAAPVATRRVQADLDGRCLSAIPRTMIESKGGESIKGMTIKDWELIEHGRRVAELLRLVGPATIQCFREPDGSLPVTDVNPRFGGAFPLPTAAGSRYPELALALATGERPEPRLGDFREGVVMTRFFSHLVLASGPDGTLEQFEEELPEAIPES